ncbi:hypothetical protein OHS33_28835 [Streptomyces sp. NBC_00536]|uniref:hypothetical protein n=1 Tax=Streptomyces sp. NBC_00536 TaxID=2975769 RepID=UPI002E7FBC36|nr:hypothetical protein [Streptomyces sp. NBC_00536]WUC81997.1 hypothetical protein OHS33_28835 [Streptomyces sp. NBC_00536]
MVAVVSQAERVERLRAQLQGRPVTGRGQRLATSTRDSGLLYGVVLRAASRLDAGLELTDLEAGLLRPLEYVFSEQEIRELGRVYAEEASSRRMDEIFPPSLTGRSAAEGYSFADLLKDLPTMSDASSQANVQVVDVGAGEGTESFDTEEFLHGQKEAGWGLTLLTSSEHAQPTGELIHARVILDKFHCVEDTNEVNRDEIYWALSAGSDGSARNARRTREYGAISKGDWATFKSDENVLLDGSIRRSAGFHIACWEADDSDGDFTRELSRKLVLISGELTNFAFLIDDFPAGQWENMQDWIMLGAMIARLIAELINFFRNEDDFVQERTVILDRAAIAELASRPGRTDYFRFEGDGGIFDLYLKWEGTLPTNAVTTVKNTAGTWGAPARLTPTGATTDTPALATFNGILHCAVRGGTYIYISRLQAGRWTDFYRVPQLVTHHAPALAVFNNRLYLAYTGQGSDPQLLSSADGTTWSSQVQLPGSATSGPALAVRDGYLHYARGYFGNLVYDYSADARTWTKLSPVPAGGSPGFHTFLPPAMATHRGKLYLAYQDLWTNRVVINTNTNTGWGTAFTHSGEAFAAPSLTVSGDTLHCTIRGYDSRIWHSTLTGASTTWTNFERILEDPTTISGPAIGSLDTGELHVVYRAVDF